MSIRKALQRATQFAARPVTLFLTVGLAAIVVSATSTTHAQTCSALFEPRTLLGTLPPDLKLAFENLKPSLVERYEKRFSLREKIRAEGESMRLIALLLKDSEATALRLKPLLDRERRSETISNLVEARNNHEARRQQLEELLLEIGYSQGTATSQRWRKFRDAHERSLETIKRAAINSVSTTLTGLPLYVRSYPAPRKKGNLDDPGTQRAIKIEIALEVARRLIAVAILAIIADELLDYAVPSWRAAKAQVFGDMKNVSRADLEAQALERWKEVTAVFTGERPSDGSPETNEIRKLIRASSKDELWLHVFENGPLTGDNSTLAPPANDSPPAAESSWTVDERRYLEQILGL